MALDVLSVAPMSAEVERLFSSSGLMLTPIRNRLEVGTLGLVQTVRSWVKAGIIMSDNSIANAWEIPVPLISSGLFASTGVTGEERVGILGSKKRKEPTMD